MALENGFYERFRPRIIPGVGVVFDIGTTVPTDGTAGYTPGAIFIKTDGSADANFYINQGSVTSSNFDPIDVGTILASNVPVLDTATWFTASNTETILAEIGELLLANSTAAGGAGPSPLLWSDVPLLDLMLDFSKGYFLREDFNSMKSESEVSGTLTQTTGSGTFTDDPSVAGGVGVLDNAANTANHATNLAFLSMQCKPGVGTHIVFEARVLVGVDDGGAIIGMMDDGTTDPIGSGTVVVNTDHAIFFRDNGTGAAAMGTQACDGTNVTSSDTTIADVDKDEYETFGIHIFGDGNTAGDFVKFYHQGVLVATVTDADGGGNDGVPDAVICPTFSIDNIGDTTQMLEKIDWMQIACFNATAGTARV